MSGVRTQRRSSALEVRLGYPERLNAMDREAWVGLRRAIEQAEEHDAVRAVVVRGDARAFCAGNDIGAMVAAHASGQAAAYFLDEMLPTFEAMALSPLPIISVVEGVALGGGVEILAFSDLVLAGTAASFGLPETRIGVWATVFVGAADSWGGRRAGARLGLTGERVDAVQAQALGIVTHVCDADDVDPTLDRILDGICAGTPDATARTKRWLNRSLVTHGLTGARQALTQLCEETLHQQEYEMAMARFEAGRAQRARGKDE